MDAHGSPSAAELIGRAEEMARVLALAARRPGALVIAGEPGTGTTRLAHEAAARLAMDGALVIWAEGAGAGRERLESALREAGFPTDPPRAARARPLVLVLGDVASEPDLPEALARRLRSSRALALMTAPTAPAGAPAVTIERLTPAAGAALARAVAPELGEADAVQVARLGDGLPARIVPIAQAARRWPGGDAPLTLPEPLRAWARRRLEGLDEWPRDLAAWVAVAPDPIDAARLGRICRDGATRIARGLDALVAAGVLEEIPAPPTPRWRFRDRVVRAVAAGDLGGGELRRRHAAALVAARAEGAGIEDLLRHAVGAADQRAVMAYATRAAHEARAGGDAETALLQAARALAWWTLDAGDAARLDALHERGMALLDLSAWEEAAEALETAADERRDLGDRDGALASITAASSARWNLGRHDAALRMLDDHLTRSRDPGSAPSAARGEALAQAAGMAVMTSRFSQAMGLAGEAREQAGRAGDDDVSTRALIFMGMAESGRGSPGGLLHLARARREGERAQGSGQRNETLAMIHESHVMLALGRPDDSAACARAGRVRARELGLVDHELVLAGNLGEALAQAGELAEARGELERAAEGWATLGRATHSPADPGLAWLLLAEGRLDDALARYRSLAETDDDGARLFEQLAPVATGHALAAFAVGRDEEAGAVLDEAIAAWERTDDRLTSIPLLSVGAEAGSPSTAARCAEALDEAAAAGVPLAGAARAYAQGGLSLRRGDPAAAAPYREAASGFDALGLRWWAARARFLAGVADGPTDAAGDDLLGARAAFRAMGADGWRRRAEARLRAMGRRIPTRALPGSGPTGGLSPRELEVLSELALGLRNRDIGARLFISERTVARHLVQINAKLGVSTRTAAVRAGRELGLLGREGAGRLSE